MSPALVLCYHAVSPTWAAPLSIEPRRLEAQLLRLLRRGYRGATFTEAVSADPHQRTLAVTFDDAYRSVGELAAPILERLGLPGTVFVPTNFAGRPEPMSWPGIDQWLAGPHERELLALSWPELADLKRRGWEIGSHTRSHPRLSGLAADELDAELTGSRDAVRERLGECRSLAYPYGDVDERVVQATRRAGYVAAAALPAGWHAPRALEWPRAGIYHGDGGLRFALKTSPMTQALRRRLHGRWRRRQASSSSPT